MRHEERMRRFFSNVKVESPAPSEPSNETKNDVVEPLKEEAKSALKFAKTQEKQEPADAPVVDNVETVVEEVKETNLTSEKVLTVDQEKPAETLVDSKKKKK